MSRRMVAPGKWIDEGKSGVATGFGVTYFRGYLAGADDPSTPTKGERSLALIALRKSERLPPKTPAEHREDKRRWKAAERERRRQQGHHESGCIRATDHYGDCRALCAKPMKLAKQPCARALYHKGECGTQARLERRAANRRTERTAA